MIFLKQIDEYFGLVSDIEDPVFDFHKNLKIRKEGKLGVDERWEVVKSEAAGLLSVCEQLEISRDKEQKVEFVVEDREEEVK